MKKIRLESISEAQTMFQLVNSPAYKVWQRCVLREVDKILNEGVKFKRPEDWAKYEGARRIAQLAERIASRQQAEEQGQEPLED